MNDYLSYVASFYDARAEDYELAFAAQPFEFRAKDFLEKTAEGGMNVLDVGCGPGHLTGNLPESVRVVGIDISAQMIGKAKAGRPSGQYFVHDYLMPLPSSLCDFDVILASGCFDLCDDLNKALQLIGKILKKGGLFYFTILERRVAVPHQAAETVNARPDQPNPISLWLWTFQEVATALGDACLSPVRYEYAPGCKSRTLSVDFFYGYWIVTKS
ncbi:MAG: class I SAM-dependent methyltransferase [Fimbriimonadaceae bacterium]|nr:class I SAM-dependent methyltransferase [Fimbriimonadaceae bacterium]